MTTMYRPMRLRPMRLRPVRLLVALLPAGFCTLPVPMAAQEATQIAPPSGRGKPMSIRCCRP